MPDDSLLAVRPCGCALATVRADSSEVAWAQHTWTARGLRIVAVAGPEAIRRLVADGVRHATDACPAAPTRQLGWAL